MFEAVVNDGQCYFTAGRQPQALGTISVKTEGGSATVESLEVFKRKSIWKKQHGNRDTMQDSRAYRRKESPHLKRPMNMIVAMVLTGAGLTAHAADEPLTDGNKAGAPAAVAVYGEKHRPQFHFFPKINWTNDPNGMANRKIAVFS
jgi:hypothetical protein